MSTTPESRFLLMTQGTERLEGKYFVYLGYDEDKMLCVIKPEHIKPGFQEERFLEVCHLSFAQYDWGDNHTQGGRYVDKLGHRVLMGYTKGEWARPDSIWGDVK